MQKFLDQFKLTGMQRVMFENYIFNMASKAVVGYCGGSWDDLPVGRANALSIPDNTGRVAIRNVFGGETVETDIKTGSVAFTMLVTNWWWNQNAEKLSNASNNAFQKAHDGLRRAAFGPSAGLNTSDLFTITD